ncbi:MAG: prolipoprotein diacylglyceryl transferase [Pseudomonadota bacterium]|nr:prolipoprotein diacylglyceryl transferase [Pseudomonadota bacterium]
MHSYDLILMSGNQIWHQFFLILALLVGAIFLWWDSRYWPMALSQKLALMLVSSVAIFLGSALPGFFAEGYVDSQIQDFFWDPAYRFQPAIYAFLLGPKSVLGGFILAFLAVAGYKNLFNVRYDTSDSFARGTIAIMAIGRLGCIAQHCCFGRPTHSHWGVDLGDGVLRYPVQVIESVFLFSLLILIFRFHSKNLFSGLRFFILFAAYGFFRFIIEFWRESVSLNIIGLGFYQWLALLMGGLGIYQLRKRQNKIRAKDTATY